MTENTQQDTTPQPLQRTQSAALDEILGQSFPVQGEGFVRVVDYMGTDASIVQAARVSYGAGTKTKSDDKGLIRYLMRHWHTSPFEMCSIKFHVRVPMDTWRQWVRHRTGKINEYSTRYSEAINATATTEPDAWRLQSTQNKQGSGGFLPLELGMHLSEQEAEFLATSRKLYESRLAVGVAREQARKDLPLSTYTEAYWSMDLHNLLHFLRLRMDSHAQLEIREFATVIGNIVSQWVPLTWDAFIDFRLGALQLSAHETTIIGLINQNEIPKVIQYATAIGWLPEGTHWMEISKIKLKPHRERTEAEDKIKRLGNKVPWIIGG